MQPRSTLGFAAILLGMVACSPAAPPTPKDTLALSSSPVASTQPANPSALNPPPIAIPPLSNRAPVNRRPTPLLSTAVRKGLTIKLRAYPVIVSPGDTVRLTAVAYNATRARIQVGERCGAAMDVHITPPTASRSPYSPRW